MTVINVVLKHFFYTICINILFDKLIENFPSGKYEYVDIDLDDIQIGDTILAFDIYKDDPNFLYGGTVCKVDYDNRSISYETAMKYDVVGNKWIEMQVIPVFNEIYYGFLKRIKRY